MFKVKLKTNWIGWGLLFLVGFIPWIWFLFVRFYIAERSVSQIGVPEYSLAHLILLILIALAPLFVLLAFVYKRVIGFQVVYKNSKRITLKGRRTISFSLGELENVRFYSCLGTLVFKLKDGKRFSVCSLSASKLENFANGSFAFDREKSKLNVFAILNFALLLVAIYTFVDFGKRHCFTFIARNDSLALERFLKIFPAANFSYKRISIAGQKSNTTALGWSSYIDSYEVPNILLRFGADINKGDLDTGDTPLSLSIANNNLRTAAQLLIDGASPLIENKKGQSVCTILWTDQTKFEKDYKRIYPLVYVRCLEGKK